VNRRLAIWALALPTTAVAVVVAARGPHWCFLPIWACGVVAVSQALREVSLGGSLLRTGAAVWSFLVFFVFGAPLLHLYWNVWLRYVDVPPDMRPWMGALAAWTLAGLLAMIAAQRLGERGVAGRLEGWGIDRRRFAVLGAVFIGMAAAAEVAVYLLFGGFSGLLAAFERDLGSFRGLGPLVVLASTLPGVAAALVLGLVPRRRLAGWGIPLFVLFTVLQLAVAGPYGSRANIIVPVLWGCLVWDRLVRPLRWKHVLPLAAAVALLLFVYGFYKTIGTVAYPLPPPGSAKLRPPGKTLEAFVLHDLGRFDVQAILLERLSKPDHWRLGRGRTYLGGILSLVPARLYPGKPETKVREGTEALIGAGSFARGGWVVSNQFGLAGEAVLNFGRSAIPVAYALFGLLVGVARRLETELRRRDPRWLLLGFVPPLAVRALMTDSDNVALLAFQSFLFLGPLVCIATRRGAARSEQ
jgi:hypothetical protein